MKRFHRVLPIAMQALLMLAGCGPAGGDSGVPPASGAGAEMVVAPLRFAGIETILAGLAARSRQRQPTLLNFWATWCEPCVDELPVLAAVAREHEGRGLEVVGISLDAWIIGSDSEAEERVRATLARLGVGYPNIIYRGVQGPLLEAFDLPGPIPHSILFDADGRVVRSWNGPLVIRELRQEIERLVRSEGRHGAGGGAAPAAARQDAT